MAKIIDLLNHKDHRGELIALESMRDVPFEIKRIYYLFNNSTDQTRAKHAHKNLDQLYIAVSGHCKVFVDDGKTKQTIVLDKPNVGLLFDQPTCREISEFIEDCVLLVLASEYFDRADYIHNYDEFIKFISDQK